MKVIQQLKQIVEAPGCILQSYKQDFYKHDVAYIQRTIAPLTRYIFIMRESGTHLVRLGVHHKMHEEAQAAVNVGSRYDAYLITVSDPDDAAKIERLDKAGIARHLAHYDFTVKDGHVFRKGTKLAQVLVSTSYRDDPKAFVDYFMAEKTGRPRELADLVALGLIAECEAIVAAQSFWIRVGKARIDELDLYDLIESERAKQMLRLQHAA